MFPASWDGRPLVSRMWWISAEVVDFPFDPVTAITLGGCSKESHSSLPSDRKNKPMSLSTGTPAAWAAAITGCGAGYRCGMPGEVTRTAQSSNAFGRLRSWTCKPSSDAAMRAVAPSSQQRTFAPPASSAAATARPERPRPRTARVLSEYPLTGIMSAPFSFHPDIAPAQGRAARVMQWLTDPGRLRLAKPLGWSKHPNLGGLYYVGITSVLRRCMRQLAA